MYLSIRAVTYGEEQGFTDFPERGCLERRPVVDYTVEFRGCR